MVELLTLCDSQVTSGDGVKLLIPAKVGALETKGEDCDAKCGLHMEDLQSNSRQIAVSTRRLMVKETSSSSQDVPYQ